MIGSFLDRISGLFDKGLILGALFPLLVFGLILGVCAASMVGWRASLFWLEDLSSSAALSWSILLTVVLLVSAFLLRSLRTWILAVWSGAGAPPWLVKCQANRRQQDGRGNKNAFVVRLSPDLRESIEAPVDPDRPARFISWSH
jgi:hypothetical protein